jgi:hypothetical protein
VNGTTAATHSSKVVSRYIVPENLNWLCRQIAALMHRKAQTGFAGKTANAQNGEVFYMDEFPKFVIEKVRNGYRL